MLIEDERYREYMAKNLEESRGLCPHDFQHHLSVARICYILVLEHNGLSFFIQDANLGGKLAAKETIYAAGLTHDIGKWKEYKHSVDHAAYGARIAREILPRAWFSPNEVDIICRAIFEHSNINKDMSFLGERLHRADNLSRVCCACQHRSQCSRFQNKEINLSSFEY